MAKRPDPKTQFSYSRRAEATYARALRQIGTQIANLMGLILDPDHPTPEEVAQLRAVLDRYAEIIEPWAKSVTQRMHAETLKRDEQVWIERAKTMSRELHREIMQAPTGVAMRQILDDQVDLITSLPREAGLRVHEMMIKAIETGARAPEAEAEIQGYLQEAHPSATERWVKNRANLIAVTETARTASVLTQARSEYVGSTEYVWRTSHDWKVRPTHRRLEGTVQKWSDPPVSEENGARSHPGQIYRCRCYPEPIIPDA